jgi:hypothetical protein
MIDEDICFKYDKETFLNKPVYKVTLPQIKLIMNLPFFERFNCFIETI